VFSLDNSRGYVTTVNTAAAAASGAVVVHVHGGRLGRWCSRLLRAPRTRASAYTGR
jgi:hypothetical protein